jgi:Flp pilus assembly CpaE family ATPase
LLDLGLPYNHAALIANLVPTSSLAAQDAAADHELEELLLSACIHHPVGMMVLSGALRVEQSELVTPELVQRALAALRRNFNYIVIDMGVSMSETALGVIERAGNVLLVLTPELTSMKDGKELIEIFQSVLSIPSGNIKVVLNHPRAGSLVTRSLVEATLGHAVDFELDHDGDRCDRAAVTGNLLIMSAPASPLAKRLKAMAGSLEAAVGAGSAQSEHHAKVAR